MLGGATDPMKAKLTLNFAYSFNSECPHSDPAAFCLTMLTCYVGRQDKATAFGNTQSLHNRQQYCSPCACRCRAVEPLCLIVWSTKWPMRCQCYAGWDDGDRAGPLQQELLLLLARTLRELGLQYSLPAIRRRTPRDVIATAVAMQ